MVTVFLLIVLYCYLSALHSTTLCSFCTMYYPILYVYCIYCTLPNQIAILCPALYYYCTVLHLTVLSVYGTSTTLMLCILLSFTSLYCAAFVCSDRNIFYYIALCLFFTVPWCADYYSFYHVSLKPILYCFYTVLFLYWNLLLLYCNVLHCTVFFLSFVLFRTFL